MHLASPAQDAPTALLIPFNHSSVDERWMLRFRSTSNQPADPPSSSIVFDSVLFFFCIWDHPLRVMLEDDGLLGKPSILRGAKWPLIF
ncbi:hypothetical protein CEXT_204681 [Caerostris extrusa]|uniref:Uncharacterized protein n=1 Tax=Caerostris extrusa TaxID=172846 RepID=A0AAV4MRN5_CAEEX|nr:hypothetical protein CEXT_204681 [Caerostris extrusa]